MVLAPSLDVTRFPMTMPNPGIAGSCWSGFSKTTAPESPVWENKLFFSFFKTMHFLHHSKSLGSKPPDVDDGLSRADFLKYTQFKENSVFREVYPVELPLLRHCLFSFCKSSFVTLPSG